MTSTGALPVLLPLENFDFPGVHVPVEFSMNGRYGFASVYLKCPGTIHHLSLASEAFLSWRGFGAAGTFAVVLSWDPTSFILGFVPIGCADRSQYIPVHFTDSSCTISHALHDTLTFIRRTCLPTVVLGLGEW